MQQGFIGVYPYYESDDLTVSKDNDESDTE